MQNHGVGEAHTNDERDSVPRFHANPEVPRFCVRDSVQIQTFQTSLVRLGAARAARPFEKVEGLPPLPDARCVVVASQAHVSCAGGGLRPT
jgi:hypothetical protein